MIRVLLMLGGLLCQNSIISKAFQKIQSSGIVLAGLDDILIPAHMDISLL
jgi:hypothetical protein